MFIFMRITQITQIPFPFFRLFFSFFRYKNFALITTRIKFL